MSDFEVRPVAVQAVRPLRQALLRPHQGIAELAYLGDDHPAALHVGGFRRSRLVGIASILPDLEVTPTSGSVWRLRGMAVDHGYRGRGLGALLLHRCLAHAAAGGRSLVWCNARMAALGFYQHFGFDRQGAVFHIDGIGTHCRMILNVPPAEGDEGKNEAPS